jgi:hypothetical protein
MSIKNQSASDLTEACNDCGRDTPHTVSIELRTESDKRENAEFSREPYRITECMACGTETVLRMNNA